MSYEWMNVEELPSVVERLQLIEGLQVSDPEFHHVHDVTFDRFLIQAFVELLHLFPSDHTIVVNECGYLDLRIEEVVPVDLRVLLVLLDFAGAALGCSFFFSVSRACSASSARVSASS